MTPTEDWLGRLIAFPTVSAETNLPLMAEVEHALTTIGAACWRFPDATGQKTALLARLGPDGSGGLMLSGHVDVVPVEGQNWTVPAFEMTRQGSKLFGRGTADMKGFIAAMLALAKRTPKLDRPLWLALSYDEEVGCIGVRPMLAVMKSHNIRPDLVIVGEPTSMQLGLGHKGKSTFTVSAIGTARHSAEAPMALNALHLAADFMSYLRKFQTEIAAHGAQEDGYSVPYATVHVGKFTGGTVVNLVPDTAELLMELRFLASDNVGEMKAHLHNIAAQILASYLAEFPDAKLVLTQTGSYPGLATPVSKCVAAFAACLPAGTETCKLSFGTEAGLFAESLGVPVIVCGPGNMAQGHRPDEYIEADQLALCDKVLDAAIQQFCVS